MLAARISIIITTRNRAEHLRNTLKSFERLQVPKEWPAELLIVDNASTDHTAEVIKTSQLSQLPVRYWHEPKPGQSNARNSGMANTAGEVIIFTDDDVRVPEHWLEAMATPILAGQADAVVGGVTIAPHLQRDWMSAHHLGWLAITGNLDFKSPGALVGANMAFSRGVLKTIPGFDPELGPGASGFADDTLFAWQILEAGLRIAGCPEAGVEHHFEPERLSRASWISSARRRGCSQAYLAYHWQHETVKAPRLQLALAQLRLMKWRFLNRQTWQSEEGCPEAELFLLRQTGFYRQYRAEMKRPRNYSKHGLVKLRSN